MQENDEPVNDEQENDEGSGGVSALLAIWQVSDDEAVVTPCLDWENDAPVKDVGRHDEEKNEDDLLS